MTGSFDSIRLGIGVILTVICYCSGVEDLAVFLALSSGGFWLFLAQQKS